MLLAFNREEPISGELCLLPPSYIVTQRFSWNGRSTGLKVVGISNRNIMFIFQYNLVFRILAAVALLDIKIELVT